MKINKNVLIIVAILLFLWYRRNNNKKIQTNTGLSSTTNWNDGLIMLTMNNRGNVYVDPNTNETLNDGTVTNSFSVYNDQGEKMFSNYWYLMQGLDQTPAEVWFDNGWLANGTPYSAVQIDSQYFDMNTWEEVYRACLDINDPNYNAAAMYHAPEFDCAHFTNNAAYNIVSTTNPVI